MPDTRPTPSGWQPELDELAHRKALAREMGGAERVDRQHRAGRLTVRERIERLLDPGSFLELGSIAGKAAYDAENRIADFTPGNGVFGRGLIDARPVVVFGDDFTVRGGSADASIREKYQMPERMAAEYRLPLIRLIEGSGGGGSVKTIETRGHANLPGGIGSSSGLALCAINMGLVPVVALGLGSVAGSGRGAAGGVALRPDGKGHIGGVRRRPAGGGAVGRKPHEAGTGRPRGAGRRRHGR